MRLYFSIFYPLGSCRLETTAKIAIICRFCTFRKVVSLAGRFLTDGSAAIPIVSVWRQRSAGNVRLRMFPCCVEFVSRLQPDLQRHCRGVAFAAEFCAASLRHFDFQLVIPQPNPDIAVRGGDSRFERLHRSGNLRVDLEGRPTVASCTLAGNRTRICGLGNRRSIR